MSPLAPLYLLSAHLVGDFLLQNRWMARNKLDNGWWRTYHVAWYCVPFVPLAIAYASSFYAGFDFLLVLAAAHWITDSRTFRASLGDWIHWKFFMGNEARLAEWLRPDRRDQRPSSKLPPNLWPLVSTAVDQTLHVAQIAIIAGLFLA